LDYHEEMEVGVQKRCIFSKTAKGKRASEKQSKMSMDSFKPTIPPARLG